MCPSVNIRAVRAPAVLNCPGTNLRPPSCPNPRKTRALFWIWPHRKTWLTPSLVQLDQPTYCSGHHMAVGRPCSLSPTLAQGRWWQNGSCHCCSHTHLLAHCSPWFLDYYIGCCGGLTLAVHQASTKATLSLPSTSAQGRKNTTECS